MTTTVATSRRKGKGGGPVGRGAAAASSDTASEQGSLTNGYHLLIGLIMLMCTFGLMMVLSSSSVAALRTYGDSLVFFKRQIVWLALGTTALVMTLRMDYQRWRRWGPVMVLSSAALLLIVLVPHVGIKVSGSQRWLGAGPLRMQPSEIAKFAMLVFGADLLARRSDRLHDWRATLRPVGFVYLILAFLIMIEPDMGTTLVLSSITISILFLSGIPLRYLGRVAAAVVGAGTVLAIAEPYRRERLTSFLHPFNDASDTGYQVVQSLIGIGSGGVLGVGLGASRSKWGFLPNAHTDFIFAIIAEELGLVGGVVVASLFIAFAVIGVRIASRAPDRFGALVAVGITAWVLVQAFLNIGAVIGILPVTGVPLPFLSQGGSSLIILMAAMGVLLNIAKQGEAVVPAAKGSRKGQ